MKNQPILLIVLIGIINLFAGCKEPEEASAGQVLRVGNAGEPQALDPHRTAGIIEAHIILALLEGLMTYDPQTCAPRPGVAERYEISPDGLVYTFYLRSNAKWSNGRPVVAEDFVRTYERILTPSFGSPTATLLYPIAGAAAFHQAINKDFSSVGVRAVDDHILEIRLESPTPYFLALTCHHSFSPLPIQEISALGNVLDPANPWTHPDHYVGNGPFVLKSWRIGDCIRVERSNHYWDPATLDAIEFYPMSIEPEERAFLAGQLDITDTIARNKIDSYRREHPDWAQMAPMMATNMYNFNVKNPVLSDVRVRRALSLALDREALVKIASFSGAKAAVSLVPPGVPGYAGVHALRFDLEEARQLLAQAGYPGGKGFPNFNMVFNTSSEQQQIAEAVQQMWSANLGINVTLVNYEWKVFLEKRERGEFDIGRASWVGDYPDPTTFLDLFRGPDSHSWGGWNSSEYDALLTKAAVTIDPEERMKLLAQAETLVLEEAAVLPLMHPMTRALVRPYVHGRYANLMDRHPWQKIYLEKEGPKQE